MDNLYLENELVHLTLKLYNNPVIPRIVVQFFIDSLITFIFNVVLPILVEKIKLIGIEQELSDRIDEIISSFKNVFDQFKTEHRRFKMYEMKRILREPVHYPIQENANGIRETYFIPLSWTLKLIFEIPGVLKLVEDYMKSLKQEKDTFSNFIQGEKWNLIKSKFEGKFVLPLFIFNDDFEAGNPLGSHAGKNTLGCVYSSIPCFPRFITSTEIFFFQHYSIQMI